MKKTSTKKALICLGVLFFLLGSFIVSAITIDPGRFVATMRIQQVNLYYRIASTNSELDKDDIVKAGMTNYGGVTKGSLYIRPVNYTGNLVDETNNVITNPDYASIIGGQMNVNNGDETTIMLGGSKNTAGGHGVVLMGGDDNTATVDNAVILGSNSSTVGSPNGVVMAANGGNVYGNNSTMFGGGGTISTGADNSFAIGGGVTINHQGVFSYGGTTSVRPNIAQFNGGQGIIVGWTKPNGNGRIKLSVNGALAVGRGQCSNSMIGSIYYKAGTSETTAGTFTPIYCLCACVASGSDNREIALSNQPYCNGVCECPFDDPNQCHPSPVKCGTRGYPTEPLAYAHGEKGWRVASRFCEDNRPPIAYYFYSGGVALEGKKRECEVSSASCNPPFPEPGETVKWVCHGVGYYDYTDCYAYRDVEAPELAECGRNSKRYDYNDNKFLGNDESDFCAHLNGLGSSDRAHNGELKGFRKLSEQQVEYEYKSGVTLVPYTTGSSYLDILNKLNDPLAFPSPGGRTYWKCVTSNASHEVGGREVTNEKICYADRYPCNTCAKDGFPYCFSVDFSDDCSPGDVPEPEESCLAGTDFAGEYQLHVSWDTQEISDPLRMSSSEIENVRGETPGLTVALQGEQIVYSIAHKNETGSPKEYKAKITAVTGSSYCPYWITTISQCQKGFEYNEAQQKCVKEGYTIKFYCGTKSTSTMSDQQMEVGVEKALNKSLCKATGFVFTGWSTTENSTLIAYKDQQKVKDLGSAGSTVKLYAVYDEVYVPQYAVVKFNRNGGTSGTMADQQFEVGISQKLSKNVFSRDGYTFSGWNRKTDGSGPSYVDEASIKFTTSGTVTLYAIWNANSVTSYNCFGNNPPVNHSEPANNKEANGTIQSNAQRFLADPSKPAEMARDCAYKCMSGYTYLKGDAPWCAKCKPGETINVEEGWCEYDGKQACPHPYVWFEQLKICAIPGKCRPEPTNIEQSLDDITPPYKTTGTTTSYCVDDAEWVQPNTCQFSCAPGYVCNSGRTNCEKASCSDTHYNAAGVYGVDSWRGTLNSILNLADIYRNAINNTSYLHPDYSSRESMLKATKRAYTVFGDTSRYRSLNPGLLQNGSVRYTYNRAGAYNDQDMREKYGTVRYEHPMYDREEKWFFVKANSETEFWKKVKGLNGCFFWCTGSNFRYNIDYSYSEPVYEYLCGIPESGGGTNPSNPGGGQGPNPQTESEVSICAPLTVHGPYGVSKTFGLKSQFPNPVAWTWDTFSTKNENAYCHVRCENGYERKSVNVNGSMQDVCYKKCGSNQYSYDYVCYDCPDGMIPDTTDLDAVGNPRSCWKECNKGLETPVYISVNNSCTLCAEGQKPDLSTTDSHGNPTSCVNICKDDEAYMMGTENCGEGLYECCLPATLPQDMSCDEKRDGCGQVGVRCVCPIPRD